MNKYVLLVLFLANCHFLLVQAQTKEVIVKEWQNAPQQNCFVAQYNAPLGSIIEINHHDMIAFVEVSKQNNNAKDSTLYLSPCIWSRFTQNASTFSPLKSFKVNIKIQNQPQQGIVVVSPAANAPIVSQSSNDNLGFQGLQGGNTMQQPNNNLGFQGLQGENTNIVNPYPNPYDGINNTSSNNMLITERGWAKVASIPSNKSFAVLHRTAPIGTLVTIRNPSNRNTCAAEVVANIAPAYAEAGVIVEVNQNAFVRLGAAQGELVEVELSYTSSTKPKMAAEKIQVASFESKYLSTERVALHPSLPAGTMINLEAMGSFTVMGKSKQANLLQIPKAIYEKLPKRDEQFIYFENTSDELLRDDFSKNTNIVEEATASVYEQKSTEKMTVWHKTIPVGTTVCVERTLYQDENRIVKSRHLVKVIGTLSASAKEDMQLSSDAWQNLQKANFTTYTQNNNNNLGFNSLQTNNTNVLYQAPTDAKVISVSIYYFAP